MKKKITSLNKSVLGTENVLIQNEMESMILEAEKEIKNVRIISTSELRKEVENWKGG